MTPKLVNSDVFFTWEKPLIYNIIYIYYKYIYIYIIYIYIYLCVCVCVCVCVPDIA